MAKNRKDFVSIDIKDRKQGVTFLHFISAHKTDYIYKHLSRLSYCRKKMATMLTRKRLKRKETKMKSLGKVNKRKRRLPGSMSHKS